MYRTTGPIVTSRQIALFKSFLIFNYSYSCYTYCCSLSIQHKLIFKFSQTYVSINNAHVELLTKLCINYVDTRPSSKHWNPYFAWRDYKIDEAESRIQNLRIRLKVHVRGQPKILEYYLQWQLYMEGVGSSELMLFFLIMYSTTIFCFNYLLLFVCVNLSSNNTLMQR